MIKKYSAVISGHKTSVSMEPEFWDEMLRQASVKGFTITKFLTHVDTTRPHGGNLSSMVRLRLLQQLQAERIEFRQRLGLEEQTSGDGEPLVVSPLSPR